MAYKLLLASALGLTIQAVFAQDDDDTYIPPRLQVSMDNTCSSGPLLQTIPECAISQNFLCNTFSIDDLPGFPTTDDGDISGWISGQDIYSRGCQLMIYETVTDNPTCGQLVAMIDQNTPCRQFDFPSQFGLGCCCGITCDGFRKRGLEYPTSSRFDAPQERAVESVAAPARAHARDIQARSPVPSNPLKPKKRQDGCNFSANDDPVDVQGEVQIVSNTLDCPAGGGSGCPITQTYSVSTSQTNTFGISTEIGGTFWEVISASVSFSYEYSFEETQSDEISYTVTLDPGQRGYLTFVPLLQCEYSL